MKLATIHLHAQKSGSVQSLHSNAYALIIHTVLTAATGYLFWIVAARRFAVESVGLASATLTVMMLIAMVADLGLDAGLIRFLPETRRGEEQISLLQTVLSTRLAVTILVTAGFFVGIPLWAPGLIFLLQDRVLATVFVSLVIVNSFYLLQNAVFIAARNAGFVLLCGALANLVRLLLIALLVTYSGSLSILLSVTVGLLVAALVGGLFCVPRLYPGFQFRIRFRHERLRAFVRYSLVNQAANLLLNTPPLILPILVLNVLGPEANAQFYITWMTTALLRTACVAISQSTFAEGASNPTTLVKSLRQGGELSLLLILIFGVPLALLGPWILSLFGHDYANTDAQLLYWLLAAVIPFCFVNLYVTLQRIQKNSGRLIAAALCSAISGMMGAVVGIHHAGLVGMAMGWFMGQLFALIFVGLLLSRRALLRTTFYTKQV